MSVLNRFRGCIYYSCPPPRACWSGQTYSELAFVSMTVGLNSWRSFSTLASHFRRAASAILFSEQRAALIQSRTLACVLCHRPNAYYDWSNGPLFASE